MRLCDFGVWVISESRFEKTMHYKEFLNSYDFGVYLDGRRLAVYVSPHNISIHLPSDVYPPLTGLSWFRGWGGWEAFY